MEKGIRAFFYDYKYYMFPDGVSSLKELKAMKSVDAKRLKEEFCMAPDFVYESMADEHVEFDDPNMVFEVLVNIYDRKEYDAILAEQVKRVCPGCYSYEDNGDGSLDGHHREISLNGTCYLRRDEKASSDYAEAFEWYWNDVATKLDALAECIDKGDQKKLNGILNKELSDFFINIDFHGGVLDGKYTLCMENLCGAMPPIMCMHYIMSVTAANDNNPMKKAGWNVFPYLHAGLSYGECDKDAPCVRLTVPQEGVSDKYEISMYHPNAQNLDDDAQFELLRQTYIGLASFAGEKLLLYTSPSFVRTDDGSDLISLREAAKRIEQSFAELTGNSVKLEFPPNRGYGVDSGVDLTEIAYPFRGRLTDGVTKCPNMSCCTKNVDEPIDKIWRRMATFAYVFVPKSMSDTLFPVDVLSRYFSDMDRVPEPIRNPRDGRAIGMMIGLGNCGADGYVVDHLIVSEKAFLRKLRILAPVLKAYDAKVVFVNSDGVAAYNCDYEFEPLNC